MPGRLEGKVAIVTGGGQGFGKGIAEKYLTEGATVVIADFSEKVGAAAAKELKCDFQLVNVTQRADWESLAKSTIEKHGKIDIVVNNAGTTYRNKVSGAYTVVAEKLTSKPTNTVTDEDFDLVFSVNVKSIYYSANVIVPLMQEKKNGGVFISIASTAGIRPRPGLTWYNASKAAVINATKTMAVEYAPDKIRFSSVCPVVALGTGLTDLFLGKKENEKPFIATIPLGRSSTPQDVANACAYLGSDEAEFITGVSLEVDGGRCV